jgi:hypothetical protein
MPFAAANSSALRPNRSAISSRVSPGRTVYVFLAAGVAADSTAGAVGDAGGRVAVGRVAVALGVSVGVGVRLAVGVEVGV